MEEGQYKIYLVTLPTHISLGYDSYDEFVVVARSAEKAKHFHPATGKRYVRVQEIWGDWVRYDQIDQLCVTEIGYADKNHQFTQIVTASFCAG